MDNNGQYTVVTIDDHPLFRKGVGDLIDMEDSLVLIGEAANGQDGLKIAEELQPDIILLDINMKGMSGLETLQAIKTKDIDSRVLMLTVSDNEEDVIDALRLGADGYLLKDMEPEDTLEYLRNAVHGKIVISERLTQLLAHALREEQKSPKTIAGADLTDRESEILKLIAEGMSNKLIARQLDISEGTVKVHVKHLLRKLNLHSRVEAAVWALKNTQ
ncbi:MAG: two-component system response regulator NarL [Sedimenticola sp.]|nr:MAG: two-component system response regulator NarL [Sedimenticola sp.]